MSSSRSPWYLFSTGFSRLPDSDEVRGHKQTWRAPQTTSRVVSRRGSIAVRNLLHQHRNTLRAAPAALASTLWLAMMLYFFIYYTTVLDKVDGQLPRIGPSYSVWPYISCIGAVRLQAFQSFAIVVATLVITSFSLDFWHGRHIVLGRWLRIVKLTLAIISDSFLVALSYESVNNASHLHLIFTSVQIWCMCVVKVVDDLLNLTLRKSDPNNEYLNVAKRWKRAAGLFALLSGPVAVIGIYSCQLPVAYLPDTARCWKLVAWAAPCEWILSICWSAYLYMVAYDLYHAEEVRESVIAKSGGGRDARLFSMSLEEVTDKTGDTEPLTRKG